MPEADILEDTSAGGSTRDRILHTAARLFSERGFDSVSLRDITTDADVNVAATANGATARRPSKTFSGRFCPPRFMRRPAATKGATSGACSGV